MALRILINGAKGRMGHALSAAAGDLGLVVGAMVDAGDDLATGLAQSDVIVDFSSAHATKALLEQAIARQKPIVIGTTGHSAAEKKELVALAGKVPCVWTGNFSTGVNTLFWISAQVARIVGAKWDVEIVETHHTAKKDAPSGTAKGLQAAIRKGNGKEAPAHSLRIGDVVGDHTVIFGTPGERVELTHRASSRDIFARGALQAAKWAVTQKPGLYDMQDVLGLK